MNILIIGEYSGFAKYLSRGFREAGHRAFVFSWGDSFKSIEQDEDSFYINVKDYRIGKYTIKNSNRIRNRFSALKLHRFISHMEKNWDCAFIINFGFVKLSTNPLIPFISMDQIKSLLKDDRQIYLSACGGDYIFYKYIIEFGGQSTYEIDKAKRCVDKEKQKFELLMPLVKGVIPISLDYQIAYNCYKTIYNYTVYPIIPLPFDVNKSSFTPYKNGKVTIMHGVNRPEAKGSNYIIPAMERIKQIYPEQVELDIVYRVPLSEYLKKMEKSTILIDQCYALFAGMNAVEAMAMGKVVLGGNSPETAGSVGETFFPIVGIGPNEDDIYCKLKELIENPDLIAKLSLESREFAIRVFDCKTVALKYIEVFLNNIV